MTKLGQWLVFVNVFAAVGLFAWAVSLSANRLDYADYQDGDRKVEGELTRLSNEVKRANEGVKAAQFGYARAAAAVLAKEGERDARKRGLDSWLADVKNPNNDNAVFRVIPKLPNGLANTATPAANLTAYNGLQGRPLPGLGTLRRRMDKLVADEKAFQEKIVKDRKAIEEASNKIFLVDNGVEKGVQADVFKMKAIRQNLRDQEAYLSDKLVNWDEQLRTAKDREKQLADRLAEYKGQGPSGTGN